MDGRRLVARLPRGVHRDGIARIGAPVAFLAAVTVAVLLVRAGLEGGSGSREAAPASTSRGETAAAPARTVKAVVPAQPRERPRQAVARPRARYTSVASGDTFGVIAARYGTTIERIQALNPGVDSHALTIGQRIRIG